MSAQLRTRLLSRRAVFAGLAAGAAGAVGAGLGLAGPAAAEETVSTAHRTLRVATFNIHHGADPDDLYDLERIATVIDSLDVDIIGLQEVDRFWPRSEFADQPQWLSRRLRMWKAYGANLILPPEEETDSPDREYGTLVLSRWPITHRENTLLPKFPDGEQRGLMRTTIATPVGLVTFANTHLQHDDAAERLVQAEAVVDLLGDDPKRTIMVGDFNAETGTPEIDVIDSAFEDAWQSVGEGPGYTYHTTDPSVRIDYVWSSSDLRPLRSEVVTDDPLASDHLPVVTQFQLRQG